MATVLDLVKHFQHVIEKYHDDEQKVRKSIDQLYNLDVTVQHLQDTGVGRTVNALRKEPGDVGQAARALVYKWKLMVAAEESDQDGDRNTDTATHNGHENGKNAYDSAKQYAKIKQEQNEKSASINIKSEYQGTNGNYSGAKRKCHSSEEEEPDTKKRRDISGKSKNYDHKSSIKVKKEYAESEDSDQSQSDDYSDSDSSESSMEHNEKKYKHKIKLESPHEDKSKHSSSHKSQKESKNRGDSIERHSKTHRSESKEKNSSTKEKSYSSEKNKKIPKEKDSSKEILKCEPKSSEKVKKDRTESTSKHRSSSEKHKSSKSNSSSEKHKTEKHDRKSEKSDKSKSSSHAQKSDKDKRKSEQDLSDERQKSKDGSTSCSSKEKKSSSSKEKSKDMSSSSTENSESHKSEKKGSSSDSKSKHSESSKHKSERKHRDEGSGESKHKSSSSSSQKSKSSSSKTKTDLPKKKVQIVEGDSNDGIDCGSGASFAEALGMISPVKSKKKDKSAIKDVSSPISTFSDMSPAAMLAPTAKLAPLPVLEISALPEISPNYKPRPPPKLLPHFTDEEALSISISSKNQRTKVYSGNKVIGKIPTLYEMCVQILQEHIDALEFTGGVPYDILKPVVDRANPDQLFSLEDFNPYLMEDTDHLWQKFCQTKFRNKQRLEMETWREMYLRCQEEQEHRLKSLTANIRMTQEAKKAPIKQTKMAYVDSIVKPPRSVARKQALHGTAHAAAGSPAARVAALAATSNVLRGSARPSPSAPTPLGSSFKPKKAPLMQKALQFMRGRKR